MTCATQTLWLTDYGLHLFGEATRPIPSRPAHLWGGRATCWITCRQIRCFGRIADKITFSLLHAFSENFVVPFARDEVVYWKGSMLGKMPGDCRQKFASLRLLYGYRFGQQPEWNYDSSLDWRLPQYPFHAGLLRRIRDFDAFYRGQSSLFEVDFAPSGFEWLDCSDAARSVVSFLRKGMSPGDFTLFVCTFTSVPRHHYRVGLPFGGHWREELNGDSPLYGGSGQGNACGADAVPLPIHGRLHSLKFVLFRPEGDS